MIDNGDESDQWYRLNRRRVLTALGTGAGSVLAIDELADVAAAWDRFDVCFRGCSEVWMIVTETDIDHGGTNDPPAVAHVIVSSGGEAVCRPVEFTAENATTIPGQFGDSPVIKYRVGDGEKILGVLEYNYNSDPDAQFDDPVWCVNANQNNCATAGDTPDLLSAPCLPDDHSICPGGDFCGGTGKPGDGDGDDDDDDGDDTGPIEVTWEDCETVKVTGSDDGLEEIIVHPLRCFPDSEACPDGVPGGRTIEDPELPLTIDDRHLAIDGDEVDYYIAAIELRGDVEQDSFGKPDDLDCSFDQENTEIDISLKMDDQTITLGADEDPVSQVTVTGTAEFGWSGWGDHDIGHAFITAWAQSDDIDTGGFTNRDAERYFDVDHTDSVKNDVEITFDVPPEVGDPDAGETIETEILGRLLVGLERGTDPDESQNIGDWRENDPMTLRVEREEQSPEEIEGTWEDCETVTVTGPDEDLEGIDVHYMLCFDGDGPCPDGTLRTVEDPDLPLTIEDQYLTVEDVEYTIAVIELFGDVERDAFQQPDDLDCSFDEE